MQAAVLTSPGPILQSPLRIEDIPTPDPQPGHVLLKVLACGVCRTDLHIVEGELPPLHPHIIPGHQIVGEIIAADEHGDTGVPARAVERSSTKLVGVSWIGGTDGTCSYCRRNMENLCDHPTF